MNATHVKKLSEQELLDLREGIDQRRLDEVVLRGHETRTGYGIGTSKAAQKHPERSLIEGQTLRWNKTPVISVAAEKKE